MAIFNLRRREVTAKIVYYGPGLSGKTTNLQHIHNRLRPEQRGELMTLATQQDRTLFFDFLPIDLGEIRGLKARFQLYTVPGQVFYNSTRKLVLKNVDGVVFVADSRAEAMRDNLESLGNLVENLTTHRIDLREIPFVIQYNKRDLPTALPVAELDKQLNPRRVPSFAAEAHRGVQIIETLSAIAKLVLRNLREKDPNAFRVGEDTASGPAFPAAPDSSPAPGAAAGKPPGPLPGAAVPGKSAAAPIAVAAEATVSALASGWHIEAGASAVRAEGDELLVPVRLVRSGVAVEIVLRIRIAATP